MKKNTQIYLIGEKNERIKLILFLFLGVITGCIIGNLMNSTTISILSSLLFVIVLIILSRKYYWIISNKGIYTPLNFGIVRYVIIVLKYIFIGDDTSELVFLNYRRIALLNLLLKSNGLGIQIIKKDREMISIIIKEELFNQDLINSIKYIRQKGININNYDIINSIKVESNGELKINKNTL